MGDASNTYTPDAQRTVAAPQRELDHRSSALSAKLQPPQPRAGIIPRTKLVDQLVACHSERVIAIVAPPGYGKTTLLAEWASKQPREVAWVSIDASDNDPAVLLADATAALNTLGTIDSGLIPATRGHTTSIAVGLSALSSAFASAPPVSLVLDHVEALQSRESHDLVGELLWRLPSGSQFAFASRSPIPLQTSLLRSRGALVEIGSIELAMDRGEAEQLLTATGAKLTAGEVDELYEHTEGWPAGLYLAGLASKDRRGSATFAFRGDDVLMADYFRTQVLSRLSQSTVSFLTRTSVLDQLCGPLCDAVLDSTGSQAVLESLEESNLMFVPLDRRSTWYRYHHLFRDLLLNELKHREPELIATLHGRAARWLSGQSMPNVAIRHAQESGDSAFVVQLVGATMQPAYSEGRSAEIRNWIEWFRTEGLMDQHPEVAVLGALVEALSGRPAGAERWTAAAEAAELDRVHTDEFKGSLAYLRSMLCRDGTAQMRADAQLAHALLDPQSRLRAGALLCEAMSHLLDGNGDLAEPILAHAFDVAAYDSAAPVAAASASLRAVVALASHNDEEAKVFVDRALAILESGHLNDYEAAIVHTAAAAAAASRGDIRIANEHLSRAARVRPLLTYAVPLSAFILLELARTYLKVADSVGARTVLREVRDILHQRPDLGSIPQQLAEVTLAMDTIDHGPVGASSLTTAELRLLPYLGTHLSFPAIGERLHVSRHTVKTQAISVYRKFGVSSRSEAIERAHEIGLLGR